MVGGHLSVRWTGCSNHNFAEYCHGGAKMAKTLPITGGPLWVRHPPVRRPFVTAQPACPRMTTPITMALSIGHLFQPPIACSIEHGLAVLRSGQRAWPCLTLAACATFLFSVLLFPRHAGHCRALSSCASSISCRVWRLKGWMR